MARSSTSWVGPAALLLVAFVFRTQIMAAARKLLGLSSSRAQQSASGVSGSVGVGSGGIVYKASGSTGSGSSKLSGSGSGTLSFGSGSGSGSSRSASTSSATSTMVDSLPVDTQLEQSTANADSIMRKWFTQDTEDSSYGDSGLVDLPDDSTNGVSDSVWGSLLSLFSQDEDSSNDSTSGGYESDDVMDLDAYTDENGNADLSGWLEDGEENDWTSQEDWMSSFVPDSGGVDSDGGYFEY